jgi:hypothetical protein
MDIITSGMAGQPAVIRLEGLPDRCGSCGEAPADGTWPLGVAGHRLAVICPACFTAVAPVAAAAPDDPACE